MNPTHFLTEIDRELDAVRLNKFKPIWLAIVRRMSDAQRKPFKDIFERAANKKKTAV
jgi:hypothetical protein